MILNNFQDFIIRIYYTLRTSHQYDALL